MSKNLKEEEKHEKGLILTIPYIAGLSESIQRMCRDFDIKTSFKSGKTLRSLLTKVRYYTYYHSHP